MGKKHAPPQPIDIFNAPSPRSLLTSSGDKGNFGKRPRTAEVTVTPSGGVHVVAAATAGSRGASVASIVVTPTGSGPAFPESPPPETIEDYGDEDVVSTSADSDEFSSGGNDGNDVGADEASTDEEGLEDFEEGSDEEGDDEEASDDSEDDEDEETTHVNFDFEALPMDEDDIDSIIHLMDQLIPDHMNEVDRDLFGSLLAEEPITTLTQLAVDPNAAPLPASMKHDSGNGVDVFGVVSLLNIGHLAVTVKNPAAISFHQLLEKNVWTVVRPGLAPHFLLTARDDASPGKKFKSMLLVSEHVRNTPQQMVTRLLDFAWETFESDAAALRNAGKKKAEPIAETNSALHVTNPCVFIILAKIQRDAEKAAALAKGKDKRGNGDAPAKQKRRLEEKSNASSSGLAVLNIEEDFIFWREEDSILYANRDERVAVHAYRCRAQYDTQPEPERPVTLAFAVSAEGLRKGLAQIRKIANEGVTSSS